MLNWLVSIILPWCLSSFLNFSPLERERAGTVVGLNDTLTSPKFPCWKKRKEKSQYYLWGIIPGCPISTLTFEEPWLTHFRLRITGRLICNAKEKTSISVKRVFFFLTFFVIISRVQENEYKNYFAAPVVFYEFICAFKVICLCKTTTPPTIIYVRGPGIICQTTSFCQMIAKSRTAEVSHIFKANTSGYILATFYM